MANTSYFTMGNLYQLQLKLEELKLKKQQIEKETELERTKAADLENKWTEQDPSIVGKKLTKIKGNPKTADNKCYSVYPWDNPLHEVSWRFGQSYTRGYFELPRELDKINQKIEETEHIIEDVKSGLTKHFDLRDHLPEQFNEALEIVKQQINDWFKADQKNNIEHLNQLKQNLIYNALVAEKYIKQTIERKTGEPVEKLSDDQLTEKYKGLRINMYSDPVDVLITKQGQYYEKKLNNKIAFEQNRNLEQEADQYFEYVKANFIDQIACYCWEIVSVEDVTIGDDGSINGTIHATNGDFYIKTIGAGGYNIQKFHYRVIMRKINN